VVFLQLNVIDLLSQTITTKDCRFAWSGLESLVLKRSICTYLLENWCLSSVCKHYCALGLGLELELGLV